jgi:uncharacterized repeat protein (TIGR03803 family)
MRKNYFTSVILSCLFVAVQAQYSKLYEFVQNNDISSPYSAQMLLSNNVLYGISSSGGANNLGCIFKVNTDGTGYSKLFDFNGTNGQYPSGSLILSGNTMFGTVRNGGANGLGCIFKIKTDGTGYTKLLDCSGASNGSNPRDALTLSGSYLYGTAEYGGANNLGCIFKIDTNGAGFVKLHDLADAEGSYPRGSLTLSGTVLYGTTTNGGASGGGSVFKINTDGSGFTKLCDLNGCSNGTLVLSGTVLYGTTVLGGSGSGSAFKVNTDGSGYTDIVSYNGTTTGHYSRGSLVLSGTVLYGFTESGGANGYGCIYKVNTNGTGYTKVLDFDGTSNGGDPEGGALVLSGTVLYGMTNMGGSAGVGCVFKINTDGSGYSKLLDCSGAINGKTSRGSLSSSGTILYGMAANGGTTDMGCIYKINTDGTGYSKLMDFSGTATGRNPYGSLTLSGTVMYGMAMGGGANNNGCIFKINTNGTGYSKLFDFNSASSGSYPYGSLTLSGTDLYGMTSDGNMMNAAIFKIKTDGTGFNKLMDLSSAVGNNPWGNLTISGSVLYGMARIGGANSMGCVFKINTDGSGFSSILDFSGTDNGAYPYGTLSLSGTTLYGMTSAGGANNKGCIFKINTDGTGYTKLLDFSGAANGSTPNSSLTLSGNILYGVTSQGGANNKGCLFQVNTDGTGYLKLMDFSGTSNGNSPECDLFLSGKTLYGTTRIGGISDIGIIFKYGIPPSVQATNISFSNVQSTQIDISWTNGDGDKRAVFVKENAGSITNPVNNTTYTASANWSSKGTQLGTSGYYCIYNGTGTGVTLTNLLATAFYSVQVFEYNGAAGAEQYILSTSTKNPYSFQRINFNYLSPMAFSDTTISLPALSTGGLQISYSSSNTSVATVSANSVTLKGPGLTNITASQAGNGSYDVAVNVVQPLYVVGLCVVRYDNSEYKNMIVWEKPVTTRITSFKIYKEFGTGTYIPVKTVPYNIYSAVIDSSSDPDTHADRYKLSVVDSTGKESRKSYFHKSPHIIFIGNNIFLQDNYLDEGGLFTPSFYYIYRGTSKSTLVLHDSISGSLSTYTDPTFTGKNMFYQVGIKKTPNCVPIGVMKAESGPYSQSLSNIAEFKGAKLSEANVLQAIAYPNPFSESLTLEFSLDKTSDVLIEVTNATGQKIADFSYNNLAAGTQQIQLSAATMNISEGMCYVKIIANEKTSILKVNLIK